ncbi:anti-phage protein KwaB [Desulforamulus aquiferis]|uniref:DUF4868 domain-containing protein n=1 Tax=Desulforamulus aquiferis TaxID=1397668 RepID=A0AAW7ZAH3_9FIRM|nr:anti-phage protein KwaB [Desulforamulus aquiferis]MDO7786066.1 DUF4868 domain-containing protein [Desulforamulus aquiferis]
MTREQLKEKIEILLNSESTIGELHFLIEREGNLEIKKGNVNEETQQKLSDEFINYLISYFSNEELQVMNLSEADDRKNAIYLYDYEEVINEFEYIKSIRENDSFTEYSFKHNDISNLKGYIVTYINDNVKLTIYKQHYPIFLLKKDTSILLRFTNSNQIDELDDDIFRLNNSFDFLIMNDELYIKEIEKLEKHYGFHEIVKSNALIGIEKIDELSIIEDITELKSMVNDISFARKLIKVSKRSPVLTEVPKDDILTFISNYSDGYLAEKVKLNEAKDALVLKTKESKRIFLKILNDDYLFSELTKHKYSSLAKDEVKN